VITGEPNLGRVLRITGLDRQLACHQTPTASPATTVHARTVQGRRPNRGHGRSSMTGWSRASISLWEAR
jgi:hypothetical protein